MSLGAAPLGGSPLAAGSQIAAAPASNVTGVAAGIASTVVGTPIGVYLSSITGVVSGISSTSVGTPTRFVPPTVGSAAGISSTALGTPSALQSVIYGLVAGFKVTRVGTPAGMLQPFAPSAGARARVGTPKAKTNRFTCAVEGIAPVARLGAPASSSRLLSQAQAIPAGRVGTPYCRFTQYGYIQGCNSTRVGRPRFPLPITDAYWFIVKRPSRVDVWTEQL